MSKADQRSAARLAIVQALYQMDVTGKGVNEILAEFESFWIGREVEGDEYKPAEVAFFRDILKFPSVDAGRGWLIFALPPAELGIHPVEKKSDEGHELYLMCDDVKKTVAELKKKKVKCGVVRQAGFGIMTSVRIPGGGSIGLYQPKHPVAIGLNRPRK